LTFPGSVFVPATIRDIFDAFEKENLPEEDPGILSYSGVRLISNSSAVHFLAFNAFLLPKIFAWLN
jgi:hypothetical protein